MNRISNPEFDGFIFTHIPKCGGSSFRRLIYESSIKSGLSADEIYIPGEGGVDHNKNLNQIDQDEIDKLLDTKKKVIADHSKYLEKNVNQISPERPFRTTFLRRPIDRFISHYNFFCFQQGHGNCKDIPLADLDLEKFSSLASEMANVQTAYLLNIEPGEATLRLTNDDHINTFRILENRFHHFGILEELDMSLDLLIKLSPEWLTFSEKLPLVNKTKVNPESSLDSEFLHEFNRINMLDIRLYRFALSLLKTRFTFFCK